MAISERGRTTILKLDSEDDVAVTLARYVADLSDKFIRQKGSFTVVLSGGTLIDTMRKLVEPPYAESIDWSNWLIFWLDERVVPLDDPESNYKLAYDGFLSKVPVPSANIYPITPHLSPEGAAADYEDRLKQLVCSSILPLSEDSRFPKFDLILLGMGPDGHVASLFPNRPQGQEKERWVTFITDSPKPPPPRITLTFPVINSSSYNALVLTGEELANTVSIALGNNINSHAHPPEPDTVPLPVELVSAEEELTGF